jgi:hypothetical protein
MIKISDLPPLHCLLIYSSFPQHSIAAERPEESLKCRLSGMFLYTVLHSITGAPPFPTVPGPLCAYIVGRDACLPWHCLVMGTSWYLSDYKNQILTHHTFLKATHTIISVPRWGPCYFYGIQTPYWPIRSCLFDSGDSTWLHVSRCWHHLPTSLQPTASCTAIKPYMGSHWYPVLLVIFHGVWVGSPKLHLTYL